MAKLQINRWQYVMIFLKLKNLKHHFRFYIFVIKHPMMKKTSHFFAYVLFLFAMASCGSSKNMVTVADPIAPPVEDTIPAVVPLKPIQLKYAGLLNVDASEITNIKLYEFVDSWIGAPYEMGGENENGIDCSSFTQHLYVNVFSYLPERTANKQFNAESTDKFIGQEFLKEGDMLFFKRPSVKDKTITHVGIYLQNNKFISASGYNGPENIRGVKISDLNDAWWQERFICAGRKPLDIYKVKTGK